NGLCIVDILIRDSDRVCRLDSTRRPEVNSVVPVLLVPLKGPEKEQPVLLDRPTHTEGREGSSVVGLDESRGRSVLSGDAVRDMLVFHLERIQRHQALVLEAKLDVPRPCVAAGPGARRDTRARRLPVLRLEIL